MIWLAATPIHPEPLLCLGRCSNPPRAAALVCLGEYSYPSSYRHWSRNVNLVLVSKPQTSSILSATPRRTKSKQALAVLIWFAPIPPISWHVGGSSFSSHLKFSSASYYSKFVFKAILSHNSVIKPSTMFFIYSTRSAHMNLVVLFTTWAKSLWFVLFEFPLNQRLMNSSGGWVFF